MVRAGIVAEWPAMLAPLLRRLHLREPVLRVGLAGRRLRRRAFESLGSSRYSRPALYDMDVQLDRLLDRRNGVFVEAGGHDGFTQSNTYFLERFRGWHGVLVEPMSPLAAQARRNRPRAKVVSAALVARAEPGQTVEMEFGDLMSNLRGTH